MGFKYRDDAATERQFISKPGVYDVVVKSAKVGYRDPGALCCLKVIFETFDKQSAMAEYTVKPDRNGGYARIESFVAATASDEDKKDYEANEYDVNEEFLALIGRRAIGRGLRIRVEERHWTSKTDPTKTGVSYDVNFCVRLPEGPENAPF